MSEPERPGSGPTGSDSGATSGSETSGPDSKAEAPARPAAAESRSRPESKSAEPAEAKTATKSAAKPESKTAELKTAKSKTAESKTAESKPAESKTAESKSESKTPGAAEPAESKPAESKTAESRSEAAESKPLASSEDEPILPTSYREGALRDAIGARSRHRDDDDDDHDDDDGDDDDDEPAGKRRSRKTIVIASVSIMTGLSIAALVFLGRANAERYFVVCGAEHVTAERGRGFPPWGSHPLAGLEWKPIALPPNAECKARETGELDELGKWYLDSLVERASTVLTDKNLAAAAVPATKPTDGTPRANLLDLAAEQLDQALLLARAPERRDQRKEIERLKGDVEYWRASIRLRDASAALLDAAKQFDAAAVQRPRHVSDAAEWASFVRKLADDLHAGPGGAAKSAAAPAMLPDQKPLAPAGVALPVEPPPPSNGSAEAPPPAPPDAGVPTGGVLL